MKTYDCFMFFNEADVLEIRFKELWNSVDIFVIVEANVTHAGNPKPYYLLEKFKDRFEPYLSKVRHIKVTDMPDVNDGMVKDRYQRSCIARGLYDIEPDDLIIISDCDEIARAEVIEMIKEDENNYDRYILCLAQLQYKLNYMKYFPYSKNPNCMVTRGRAFTDPQQERQFTFHWLAPPPPDTVHIDHGGWHFTYFGDDTHAITKIQNFAHTETNTPDMISRHNIDWFIENKYGHHGPKDPERFEIIQVDEYFPECVTSNLEKYKDRIVPGAVFRATDLYR